MYSAAIICYGAFLLVGIGTFKQFSVMFKGIPVFWMAAVYSFNVLYGICNVYCGGRLLRSENWARKVVVAFTSANIVISFILNKTVMTNFKEYVFSAASKIPPDMAEPLYNYTIFFIVMTTLFELGAVVLFTRPSVIARFTK